MGSIDDMNHVFNEITLAIGGKLILRPMLILSVLSLSGCTTIVTTNGERPSDDRLETVAIDGWNKDENMRELGAMDIPVADLGLSKARAEFEGSGIAGRDGECPAGTVPYLSTERGRNITNKTIIASGYGAPPSRQLSPMQKRLLALRAAKLDAIRTLAERVSGIHIWGGATLSDLVVKSDRVHVQLDSFIRGARMISMNHMNDGSYEAVMEVNFNSNVLQRLNMNRCLPADQVMKMQYSSL